MFCFFCCYCCLVQFPFLLYFLSCIMDMNTYTFEVYFVIKSYCKTFCQGFLWYLEKLLQIPSLFFSSLKEIRKETCINLYFKDDLKRIDLLTYFMHADSLFLYPLKISKSLWFCDVLKGYRKRSVVWNGLSLFQNTFSFIHYWM